jgi:hypothetical protein
MMGLSARVRKAGRGDCCSAALELRSSSADRHPRPLGGGGIVRCFCCLIAPHLDLSACPQCCGFGLVEACFANRLWLSSPFSDQFYIVVAKIPLHRWRGLLLDGNDQALFPLQRLGLIDWTECIGHQSAKSDW